MRHFAYHLPKMLLMALIAAVVFGGGTMLLWNALMPAIFGLSSIGFLQAIGLVILGRLVFGFGFGGLRRHHHGHHGPMGHHHSHLHEKWANMTPEERSELIRERHPFFRGRPDKPETGE